RVGVRALGSIPRAVAPEPRMRGAQVRHGLVHPAFQAEPVADGRAVDLAAAAPAGYEDPAHVSSSTRAALSSASWTGAMGKTASGRPAAAQTTSWRVRSRDMKTGSTIAWPNGGTPPIAYPVASNLRKASAFVPRPHARPSRPSGS